MSMKSIPVKEETFRVLKKKKLLRELEGEKVTWDDVLRDMIRSQDVEEKSAEISSTSDDFSVVEQSLGDSESDARRRKYASVASKKNARKLPADSDYLVGKTVKKLREGVSEESILRGLRSAGLDEEEAEAVLEVAKKQEGFVK